MTGLMPRRLQFLFPIFPASRQRRLFPKACLSRQPPLRADRFSHLTSFASTH